MPLVESNVHHLETHYYESGIVTAEKKVPSYFPATSQLLPSDFPDFDVGTRLTF
jgi:hypothetical protein